MSSPIADLTYRNYDGGLESPRMRWWVIAKSMIQMAMKKKALWIFAALSSWYYVGMIFVLFIFSQIAVSSGGAGDQTAKAFFDRIVWKDQFLHGFSFGQLMVLAASLLIGAGSIANDNRANALLVYLSKPCSKLDYVIGKWVGIFIPVFVMTVVPGLIFYLYGALSYREYNFISDDPFMLFKFLLAVLLSSIVQSSLVVGVSSMFNQGRLAGATIAGAYFLSNFFTQLMVIAWNTFDSRGGGGSKELISKLYYASIDGYHIGLMKSVLGTDGTPYFGIPSRALMVPRPELLPMLAIGLLVVLISLGLAWNRVRAVEVV